MTRPLVSGLRCRFPWPVVYSNLIRTRRFLLWRTSQYKYRLLSSVPDPRYTHASPAGSYVGGSQDYPSNSTSLPCRLLGWTSQVLAAILPYPNFTRTIYDASN